MMSLRIILYWSSVNRCWTSAQPLPNNQELGVVGLGGGTCIERKRLVMSDYIVIILWRIQRSMLLNSVVSFEWGETCSFILSRRFALLICGLFRNVTVSGRLGLSSLQNVQLLFVCLHTGFLLMPLMSIAEWVRVRQLRTWNASYLPFGDALSLTSCDYWHGLISKDRFEINATRGFLGMFGSLDCMHWTWKNCPTAWQGQFQDKDGLHSIIMEAIANQSLWIWACIFWIAWGQ